jgi:RNA polymerase sigma-70 factor, ECF subfamily
MALAQSPAIDLWQRDGMRWCGWHLTSARGLWLALARQLATQTSDESQSGLARPQAGAFAAEYERFIRQYERQILNYLWRMTGDEHAAYDLTQEVFLRAWQRFDTLRRYEQPRKWLFRVATNLALTHLKRRSRQGDLLSALDEEHEPAGGDPAWGLAESDLVRRTLLRLSPKRRAALVLREVYELTSEEVGHILGMSATSVRMALHRGREQFRELYRQEGGTDGDA